LAIAQIIEEAGQKPGRNQQETADGEHLFARRAGRAAFLQENRGDA
jgi:hypothetical protein